MTTEPTDPSTLTDDVLQAVQELLDQAADGVDSESIADRIGSDRLSVEQTLKQLAEHDRLTATFYVDKPAVVSELGDVDAADDIPARRGSDAEQAGAESESGQLVEPRLGGRTAPGRPQDYDEFEPTATKPRTSETS